MLKKTEGTEIIELENGVYARLHDGLTNAGIIIGDDSVMVIDSLRVPSFARDLIQDIKHITDKKIKFILLYNKHNSLEKKIKIEQIRKETKSN